VWPLESPQAWERAIASGSIVSSSESEWAASLPKATSAGRSSSPAAIFLGGPRRFYDGVTPSNPCITTDVPAVSSPLVMPVGFARADRPLFLT
jgi:hypothetical protein